MNQVKIGSFIAERRRARGLTQMQLGEMLGITDRAISKWECGRAMPDSQLMLELCDILGISVTDLLNGEVVTMEKFNEKSEQNLIDLIKQKEDADKQMLMLEIVIGVLSSVILFSMVFVAAFLPMKDWVRIVLIVGGFIPFIIGIGFAVRIEQTAGYYECQACSHRYVPSFKSVLFAMHTGRTRYMKCPKCGKRTWQKKVISKD
ncbi:MAG: helix-turn-helix domain-containing protein [Clostridia bacterium]|nr:helix-turn-helix domain-containing protein [Clostridia bacterium]